MIDFVMVLLVYNTSLDEKYVGHFKSCEVAQIHYFMYEDEKYDAFRCIPKAYATLPEGTTIKYIDMNNNTFRYKDIIPTCNVTRDCIDV